MFQSYMITDQRKGYFKFKGTTFAMKCLKSDLKRIRVHDLRYSHASLLIELGFSSLLISERRGHEIIETTLNTYSHLCPNKHGEVANKLQELTSSQH